MTLAELVRSIDAYQTSGRTGDVAVYYVHHTVGPVVAKALFGSMTPQQVRDFLEGVSNLLRSAHDGIAPATYDWFEAQLLGLQPTGIALIAGVFGLDEAVLKAARDKGLVAVPQLKAVLTSPAMLGFAAFLHDAESRNVLINIIARWL